MWVSAKTDRNGQVIEQFVNHHNLTILNEGEGTRLDPRTGKLSCLVICITTSSLACISTWRAMKSLFGSDHFPINF